MSTADSSSVYGYMRVSTAHQNLDRQVQALLSVEGITGENIFSDKMTGTIKSRPGLDALREKLKPGDKVYITELSRLSRSVEDLLSLIREFKEKNVSLYSLKESFVFDTNSTISNLILLVLAAVAEFERAIIVERVRAGVEVAKSKGKTLGRPRTDRKKIEDALKLHDSGDYTVSAILKMTQVSRSTFYRVLRNREEVKALEGIDTHK